MQHYNIGADLLAISKDEISCTNLNKMDVTQCRQGLVCHMEIPIFKPSCTLHVYLLYSRKIIPT